MKQYNTPSVPKPAESNRRPLVEQPNINIESIHHQLNSLHDQNLQQNRKIRHLENEIEQLKAYVNQLLTRR